MKRILLDKYLEEASALVLSDPSSAPSIPVSQGLSSLSLPAPGFSPSVSAPALPRSQGLPGLSLSIHKLSPPASAPVVYRALPVSQGTPSVSLSIHHFSPSTSTTFVCPALTASQVTPSVSLSIHHFSPSTSPPALPPQAPDLPPSKKTGKSRNTSTQGVEVPPQKLTFFNNYLQESIARFHLFIRDIKSIVLTELSGDNFSPFLKKNSAGKPEWNDIHGTSISNRMGTKILSTIIQCNTDFLKFVDNPTQDLFKIFYYSHLTRLGLVRGVNTSQHFLNKKSFHKVLEKPDQSSLAPQKTLSSLHLIMISSFKAHATCRNLYMVDIEISRSDLLQRHGTQKRKLC